MVKMQGDGEHTSVCISGMEFPVVDGVVEVPEGAVKTLESLGFKVLSSTANEAEPVAEPVDEAEPVAEPDPKTGKPKK